MTTGGNATSSELTGGAGFSFEDAVAAIYLTALLGETGAPGLPSGRVTSVAVQRSAFGEPMDDLIVTAVLPDGSQGSLALQVKTGLTIRDVASNRDFHAVVKQALDAIRQPDFQDSHDRIGVAIKTIGEERRELRDICEWARASPTLAEFQQHFQPGRSNDKHRSFHAAFSSALRRVDSHITDEEIHRLLSCFITVTPDVMHEGATDEAYAIAQLARCLASANSKQAAALFSRLERLAREAAGRSSRFTRSSLLAQLRGQFRFLPAMSLADDLDRLRAEARLALRDITHDIRGVRLSRDDVIAQVQTALNSSRFVQLSGLPGSGKSVVLRQLAEFCLEGGPTLVLKADRLVGRGWMSYRASLGIETMTLEPLLSEIDSTGIPILFIDGLDRVEPQQHAIVNDILATITSSPAFENWRVIASVRDNGVEPIRTWLASSWLGLRTTIIDVPVLSESEAEAIAQQLPTLRPVLFGTREVREVARRPFFLSVLSRLSDSRRVTTEHDLIQSWWEAGGYDPAGPDIGGRQAGLLALASEGTATLGARIPCRAITPATLVALQADGIIRPVAAGHTVAFSHDIYFEWAFLHLLIEREEEWSTALREAGEPPVLGRVIELLSQRFSQEPARWQGELLRLESLELRSQWIRAWLLGPFTWERFAESAEMMEDALLQADAGRLAKLLVWFQADKTRPNPMILRQLATAQDAASTLRMADEFAWPADFSGWRRLIDWIINTLGRIPDRLLPDVLRIFEVWQNVFAGTPNARSDAILSTIERWLYEVEDYLHPEDLGARPVGRDIRQADDFERRLRQVLLVSCRAYPGRVVAYLDRLRTREWLGRQAFKEIVAFSQVIVDVAPRALADFTLEQTLEETPQELATRAEADDLMLPRSSHDPFQWRELSIGRADGAFDAPSPLQQPFAGLFEVAPSEGRRLVRELCNHSIQAWRQLSEEEGRLPIPLELQFPWGKQTFYGDDQIFGWHRGVWGPDAAQGALMALEAWAFREADTGRPLDDILRDILEGNESCAVLGVAVSLVLEARVATPGGVPLIGSARLWNYDLRRWQQDQGMNPNLMAFAMSPGSAGHRALAASNALESRTWNLRDLTPIFIFSSDAEIAAATRMAIRGFVESPPIDDESQRRDPNQYAEARRLAAIWADLGNPDEYVARRPESGNGVYIQHTNPHAEDPDVIDAVTNVQRMNEAAQLKLWARDAFESDRLPDGLSVNEAIARARAIDDSQLFRNPRDHGIHGMQQSGVSGVAATVLRYAVVNSETEDWARSVVLRAASTPESEVYPEESVIPDHPCVFAAKGFGAVARGAAPSELARENLFRLSLHHYNDVSVTALSEAMGCWEQDRELAWAALCLGTRLSLFQWTPRGPRFEFNRVSSQERRERNAEDVFAALLAGTAESLVPVVPQAWVALSEETTRGRRGGRSSEGAWVEPEVGLRWDYLAHVLNVIPVEQMLRSEPSRSRLIEFVRSLLAWTFASLSPPWVAGEEGKGWKPQPTELVKWRSALGRFLGKLCLHADDEEINQLVLQPLFREHKRVSLSIIETLLERVVVEGIFFSPTIHPRAMFVVGACLEYFLTLEEWKTARRRGDIYNHELERILRILLFLNGQGTVHRFSYGNWSEFEIVRPFVELLVIAIGDVPLVARTFVELCERAGAAISIDWFADMALQLIREGGNRNREKWKEAGIPPRLALSIQAVAERGHPLPLVVAQKLLRALDALVDMGDRRSAALQVSVRFRNIRRDARSEGDGFSDTTDQLVPREGELTDETLQSRRDP